MEQHREKQCHEAFGRILIALTKKDRQLDCVFLNRVDPEELPDYAEVIKQPICIRDMTCVCAAHFNACMLGRDLVLIPFYS